MLTKFMERNDSGKANSSSDGQEIRAFYGIRKFITAFQTDRNLSIPRATLIQPTLSKLISLVYISICSFHLRLGLPSDPFLQVYPPKSCTHLYSPQRVPRAPPSSLVFIWSPGQHWVRSTNHEALCPVSSSPLFVVLRAQISSSSFYFRTLSTYVLPSTLEIKFQTQVHLDSNEN